MQVDSYPWPEVVAGADLAALVGRTADLVDGDVVVLTSKVVSKSQGLVVDGDRSDLIARESVRVVARRGTTVITETTHGLVMAAAGVDASNVPPGSVVALPNDPDAVARRLRDDLAARTGCNVAVVITDTAGRAWRNGQTDMAIGCAGIAPLVDLAGSHDTHANVLQVTAPAVGDELAAAADLVKGKASGRPMAVVRGLAAWVLPTGEPGPGAVALVRQADDDLFGLGARDAVAAAVLRVDPVALAHFPRRIPADPEPFQSVASPHPQIRLSCRPDGVDPDPVAPGGWLVRIDIRADAGSDVWLLAGRLIERVAALAAANRLHGEPAAPVTQAPDGWRILAADHWFVA